MPEGEFVLAIDFGGTKIALATADVAGEILQRTEIPTLADRGAEQAMARAVSAGQTLVNRTAQHGQGQLRAVGVSTMGITLEEKVLASTNVPGWERLAIPGILRQAFRVDIIRIENDVKAATYAELRWGALQGVSNGIYLNLGTGIAAGLVVGGRIVRGSHGAAGEIAFNPRSPEEVVGAGDGHAPLEEFVGGKALAARARHEFGREPGDLFRSATHDPAACAFIESLLREVAYHLTNLAIALDPTHIAVGAGLMRSADVILPFLTTYLTRFVPFPPRVTAAHFLTDAALMGAVALALDPMPAV